MLAERIIDQIKSGPIRPVSSRSKRFGRRRQMDRQGGEKVMTD